MQSLTKVLPRSTHIRYCTALVLHETIKGAFKGTDSCQQRGGTGAMSVMTVVGVIKHGNIAGLSHLWYRDGFHLWHAGGMDGG